MINSSSEKLISIVPNTAKSNEEKLNAVDANEKCTNIEIEKEELRRAIRNNDFKTYEQRIKQNLQFINAKDEEGIYFLLRAAMDIRSEFYTYLNLNFKVISMQWLREDIKISLHDLITRINDYNIDLQKDNQNKAAWVKKSEILFALKSYEQALVCNEELLKLDNNNYEFWTFKGITLSQLHRYGESSACFNHALKLDEKKYMPSSVRAQMLMTLGRYDEALISFEEDLEKNENNRMFWLVRGELFKLLRRYEEALMCYEKALQLDKNDINAWMNKGNLLYNLNSHEQAVSCYDEVLKLNKDHMFAWMNKGNALYNLNRHEEASFCYEESLKLDKNDINAWMSKGKTLYNLNRHEEALLCFEEVLKLDKDDIIAWIIKGNALLDLQRYNESLECFEKLIDQKKHTISIKQNKANALIALKRFDLAKELLNQSLQMISEATGNKEYLFAQGYQGLAIIAEYINETETASEHFQKIQTYFVNLSIQDKLWVLESKLRVYRALQPQKVQSVLEEIKAVDAHHPMVKRILEMYESKKTRTLISSSNMGELLQTQGSFKTEGRAKNENPEEPENLQSTSNGFIKKV